MADDRWSLAVEIESSGARVGGKLVADSLKRLEDAARDAGDDVGALEARLERFARESRDAQSETRRLAKQVDDLERGYKELEAELRDSRRELERLRKEKRGGGDAADKLSGRIAALVAALGLLALSTREVTQLLSESVRVAAEYEKALAGVGKTTNLPTQELDALGKRIATLAKTDLPLATTELLAIAEGAGQLGVEGPTNILAFVEAVGKIVPSTDLSAEAASTNFARILNITGEALGEVGRFASQVVALGNSFPAVESEILRATNEVARSTSTFQIGSAAAAAFATALVSVGSRAEVGGSALGRLFNVINRITRQGGPELERLAEIAGTTGDEFKRAFADDAAGAVTSFLRGLSRLDPRGVVQALGEFGLKGEEINKTLPPLAQRVDILAAALRTVQEDAEAGGRAIEEEFARFAETFDSQRVLTENAINSFKTIIGVELLPVLSELLVETRRWLEENEEVARSLGKGLASAAKVAGTSVGLLADNLNVLLALLVGVGATKAAAAIAAAGGAAKGATAAVAALNAAVRANPLFFATAIGTFAFSEIFSALRREAKEAEIAIAALEGQTEDFREELDRIRGLGDRALAVETRDLRESELRTLEAELAKVESRLEELASLPGVAVDSGQVIALRRQHEILTETVAARREEVAEADRLVGTLGVQEAEEKGRATILREILAARREERRVSRETLQERLAGINRELSVLRQVSKTLEEAPLRTPFGEDAAQQLEAAEILARVAEDTASQADLVRLRLIESGNAAALAAKALELGIKPAQLLEEHYLRAAQLAVNQETSLQNQIELQREMNEALGRALALREVEVPELEAEFDISPPTEEQVEEWTEELRRLTNQRRREQVFEALGEGLQDALSDGLQAFFADGLDAFEDFFEAVSDLATSIFAEVVAAQLRSLIDKQLEQAVSGEGGFLRNLLGGKAGSLLTGVIVAGNVARAENPGAVVGLAALGAGVGFAAGNAFGAKVGAIVGSTLASFFKSGTPEFFGAVEAELGRVTIGASDLGGGFGTIASSFGDQLDKAITQILDQFGAELAGVAAGVDLKLKDGKLSVFLDGQEFRFKEQIEEGLSFAIVEILRRAELTGIEDEVRTALANTQATSVAELVSDIEFARELARAGLGDIARTLLEFGDQAEAAARRAERLGLPTEGVFTQLGRDIARLEDQILGRQEDPLARLERQAEAFNRAEELREAELRAKQAELEVRRATLQAQIQILEAESQLDLSRLDIRRRFLDAEGEMVSAEGSLLQARLDQLAALDQALAVIAQQLETIGRITDEELAEARDRIGRGRGRGRRQAREAERQRNEDSLRKIEDRIASLANPALVQTLADLQAETDAAIEEIQRLADAKTITAERAAELTEQLERSAAALAKQKANQAADALLADILDFLGQEEEAARLRFDLAKDELQIRIAELELAQERFGLEIRSLERIRELSDDIEGRTFEEVSASRRAAGDSPEELRSDIQGLGQTTGPLRSSLEAAERDLETFGERIRALSEAGKISSSELVQATDELEAAGRRVRSGIVLQEAGSLVLDLLDLLGEEERSAELRFSITLAELELRRAELQMAIARMELEQEALGTVIEALVTIDSLLDRVRAAGPALLSGGGATARGGGVTGAPDTASRDQERAEQLLLQRLEGEFSPLAQEARSVTAEFEFLRAQLGDSRQLRRLESAALRDLVDQLNASTRSLLEDLEIGASTRDPAQQASFLLDRAAGLVEASLAAPTDEAARARADEALRLALSEVRETFAPGSASRLRDEARIRSLAERLLGAATAADLSGLGPGPFGPGRDSGAGAGLRVSAPGVVGAIREQTDERSEDERTTSQILAAILTAEQEESLGGIEAIMAALLDPSSRSADFLSSLVSVIGEDVLRELGFLEAIEDAIKTQTRDLKSIVGGQPGGSAPAPQFPKGPTTPTFPAAASTLGAVAAGADLPNLQPAIESQTMILSDRLRAVERETFEAADELRKIRRHLIPTSSFSF